MGDASRQAHWENVYTTKGENEVSWFQQSPAPSLELIVQAGADPTSAIIDIGGGASRLVDHLVEQGFEDVSVLDLSSAALKAAKARLGGARRSRSLAGADATIWEPVKRYDIWHDRAAFHFLTDAKDRAAYIARLTRGLKAGDTPSSPRSRWMALKNAAACPSRVTTPRDSGRRSVPGFRLVHTRRHEHATPWHSHQVFQFSVFRCED
jgi:hypothetical protein